MALSKTRKSEVLNNLIENFKNSSSIGFTKTFWLTVSETEELRWMLREVDAVYIMSKKTLIKKALKEALDLDLDLSLLPWQISVICSKKDPIAWLSKANAFIKDKEDKKAENQKIEWVLSVFEGEIKGIEDTKIIANMPSKDTLLSRLVWSMMSPLSSMARFLDAAAKEIENQWKTKVWELKNNKDSE